MDEYSEVTENAKASWRRGETSTQDLLDICRRAGLDAALSATAADIEAKRLSGEISFKQAKNLTKELEPQ